MKEVLNMSVIVHRIIVYGPIVFMCITSQFFWAVDTCELIAFMCFLVCSINCQLLFNFILQTLVSLHMCVFIPFFLLYSSVGTSIG